MVGHHSAPFSRADSPIGPSRSARQVPGLHRATVGLGLSDPRPRADQQGYEPSRFFNHLAFAGGHLEAVTAVLNGDFDAGVTWSSVIGDVEEGYSRGNLRRMVERGQLEMAGAADLMAIGADSRGAGRRAQSLAAGGQGPRPRDAARSGRPRSCLLDRIVGDNAVDFEPITHEQYESIVEI